MIDSLLGVVVLGVFFGLVVFLAKTDWVKGLGEEIDKRSKR